MTETDDAAAAVREGVVRLSRRLQAQRQEHAVSATGIALLSRLYRAGPASPKALAAAESAAPQTLTRVFASLEEDGLVTRRPDPHDGRSAILELAPAGRALLRAHADVHVAWLSDAMAVELTAAERDLLRVAAALLDRLADHR